MKDFVRNRASLHIHFIRGPVYFYVGRADEQRRRLERLPAHLPQGKHVGKEGGTRRESESRRRLSTATGGVASRSNYPWPAFPHPPPPLSISALATVAFNAAVTLQGACANTHTLVKPGDFNKRARAL